MAEAGDPPPDLTHLQWSHPEWLRAYPLTEHTVLDYFAFSDFYDRRCNNELCKQQQLPLDRLRFMPAGLEYAVDLAAPPLFVIKRQWRQDPLRAVQQAYYFVLDGKVFQAPPLYACLQSRLHRCLHSIAGAYKQFQADLDPLYRAAKLEELKAEAGDARPIETPMPPRQVPPAEMSRLEAIGNIINTALSKHPVPEHDPSLPDPAKEAGAKQKGAAEEVAKTPVEADAKVEEASGQLPKAEGVTVKQEVVTAKEGTQKSQEPSGKPTTAGASGKRKIVIRRGGGDGGNTAGVKRTRGNG